MGYHSQAQRSALFIITKRAHRFEVELPGTGEADGECDDLLRTCQGTRIGLITRLPLFLNLPIKHRTVIHEPMLEQIDIRKYLTTGKIEGVTCGGESGPEAKSVTSPGYLIPWNSVWRYDVPFWFKQTGGKGLRRE